MAGCSLPAPPIYGGRMARQKRDELVVIAVKRWAELVGSGVDDYSEWDALHDAMGRLAHAYGVDLDAIVESLRFPAEKTQPEEILLY